MVTLLHKNIRDEGLATEPPPEAIQGFMIFSRQEEGVSSMSAVPFFQPQSTLGIIYPESDLPMTEYPCKGTRLGPAEALRKASPVPSVTKHRPVDSQSASLHFSCDAYIPFLKPSYTRRHVLSSWNPVLKRRDQPTRLQDACDGGTDLWRSICSGIHPIIALSRHQCLWLNMFFTDLLQVVGGIANLRLRGGFVQGQGRTYDPGKSYPPMTFMY